MCNKISTCQIDIKRRDILPKIKHEKFPETCANNLYFTVLNISTLSNLKIVFKLNLVQNLRKKCQ
jgi:hypothetical protein